MSAHGADTALNRESLGIFCFSLFILILCLPVREKNKNFLVWEHVVSAYGAYTDLNRESLEFFCFYLFFFVSPCLY